MVGPPVIAQEPWPDHGHAVIPCDRPDMTLNGSKSARVAASWVAPWPQEASAWRRPMREVATVRSERVEGAQVSA
jgi:hypothetical protein